MPISDYFFFSYARQDEDDRDRILKFYDALCKRVRAKSRLLSDEDPVGFIDRELRPGAEWPVNLPEALATAKSIVCLYSPKYFFRPACGKEAQVFLDRRRAHGGNPAVVLP